MTRTTKQLEIPKPRFNCGIIWAADKVSSPTKRDLEKFYDMAVKLVHPAP